MIAQFVPVLLAFGANLDQPATQIRDAQRALQNLPGINGVRVSELRESIAVTLTGPDPDAPRYVNGVATMTTTLGPHELLARIHDIETAHGRTREVRWGDRTLDIDIITYGGKVIEDDTLTVPHPRAHKRDFVLAPWLALDPDAVLMGHGPVASILARLGDTTSDYTGEDPREGLT